MARDLHANMAAEIVKPVISPFLLFECTLADNSVARYWTGHGPLSWGGNTYVGSGMFIGIGPIDESAEIKGQGVTVVLNGVPLAAISLALASLANGRQGIIRLGMFDPSNNVILNPKVMFRGRLDGCEIKDGIDATLSLSYEHELTRLLHPNEWRWTDESQKKLYPDDRGLEHIAALQDIQVPFGNETAPWH